MGRILVFGIQLPYLLMAPRFRENPYVPWARDRYDPEFYALAGPCESVAAFVVYPLCRLLWPEKRFYIADNDVEEHVFVTDFHHDGSRQSNHRIFDIIYQSYGRDASYPTSVNIDPVDFYFTNHFTESPGLRDKVQRLFDALC